MSPPEDDISLIQSVYFGLVVLLSLGIFVATFGYALYGLYVESQRISPTSVEFLMMGILYMGLGGLGAMFCAGAVYWILYAPVAYLLGWAEE